MTLPERPEHPVPGVNLSPCEYVSRACAHRQHDVCDTACRYCLGDCLCVCHRWTLPLLQ